MAPLAENLEVEVKFFAPDLELVRERLGALGATLKSERTFEQNVLFDNAWNGLSRKGQVLRLRQDRRVRLTFKGNPPRQSGSEARVREELEVEASDFTTLATILERIGFTPRRRYEKYRETQTLGEVEIVLDELPFGNFVELEGEEASIRSLASRLGLKWDERILGSYLYLMELLQRRHQLPFKDLTFVNFEKQSFSVADILQADPAVSEP